MNRIQLEGRWKQIRGKVRERWGRLTHDDLEVIAGRRDQLVGKIQERYGITREQAHRVGHRVQPPPHRLSLTPALVRRGNGARWECVALFKAGKFVSSFPGRFSVVKRRLPEYDRHDVGLRPRMTALSSCFGFSSACQVNT